MKRFTLALALLIGLLCQAQNYSPITSVCKKLFVNKASPYIGHSLVIDSVKRAGVDSVYFNFFQPDWTTSVSTTCPFWCPPSLCHPINVPAWIGTRIKFNNLTSLCRFYTLQNDSLALDLSTMPGDTTVFYQNSSVRYLTIFQKTDTLSFLGVVDSVKFYRLQKTDLNNNPLSSVLNNEFIINSKNFGLVQMVQVDSFPQVLSLCRIAGFTPSLGLTALTNEKLYDFQPGDKIECHSYYNNFGSGPPTANYDYYTMYSYLTRTTTVDSLIYSVERYQFNTGSSTAITDTIVQKYLRFDTVAALPFEKYNAAKRSIFINNYCGLNLWTYDSIHDAAAGYCAATNCWGCIDTQGPPPGSSVTYVAGLGIYSSNTFTGWTGFHFTTGTDVVYFLKDSIACGTPVISGVNRNDLDPKISIHPNPTHGPVYLEIKDLAGENLELSFFDIFGKLIFKSNILILDNAFSQEISVMSLPSGTYALRVTGKFDSVIRKLIVCDK